jgi:hypothetical protein
MTGKRPSLAESMRQAVRPEPDPAPSQPSSVVRPAAPEPSPARPAAGFYAATRAGKKKVTASIDPSKHKQLKSLALERDTTTEALLEEAINDLFAKHGINRSA